MPISARSAEIGIPKVQGTALPKAKNRRLRKSFNDEHGREHIRTKLRTRSWLLVYLACDMLYYLSEHVFTAMEASMDNISEWTEQLLEAEQQIAEAYNILATLQADLKAAGRKKDTQAIGEVVERLARYGRLFEDIRQSWTEVPD
jgi:hypothetical protein